jgi:hypothetical protein
VSALWLLGQDGEELVNAGALGCEFGTELVDSLARRSPRRLRGREALLQPCHLFAQLHIRRTRTRTGFRTRSRTGERVAMRATVRRGDPHQGPHAVSLLLPAALQGATFNAATDSALGYAERPCGGSNRHPTVTRTGVRILTRTFRRTEVRPHGPHKVRRGMRRR